MAGVGGRRDGAVYDLWDLLLVGGLVALTDAAVFLPQLSETPIRTVLGFPFALVLPGYAVVAALYPRRSENGSSPLLSADDGTGLGPAERVGLSVGLSVATVGLGGLALHEVGVGVALRPVMATVSAVSVAALAAAAVRRLRLPAERRYAPALPTPRLTDGGGPTVSSRAGTALNVVLAASVLLAGVGAAYALAGPANENEHFTELSLLAPSDSGPPVAAGYPTTVPVAESRDVVVGVTNRGQRSNGYTVVAQMQRVTVTDGEVTVQGHRSVERFRTTVAPGETARHTVTVSPVSPGQRRLVFLLYRGDPPADPSLDSAAMATHLNLTAVASG